LLGTDPEGRILVVGAHHIEPTLVPDVGYAEVIAVASDARGTLVQLPQGLEISLGELMVYAIFKPMLALGRYPRAFALVDRRNVRSMALRDRVGSADQRPSVKGCGFSLRLVTPRR
jgi:hypothetical protein